MHSAIICACAATLKPFIQRYFGPIFTSTHDSTPSNYVQATDYSGQQTRDAKATQLSTSTTNSYSHSSSDGNAHDDVEIGPFRELAASSSAFGSGYGDHGSSTTNVCKGPTLDSYEVVL